MKKYIRVKVGETTYHVSQITGNIYYTDRDGEDQASDLVSLQYCHRIIAGKLLSPYWIKRALAILNGYDEKITGKTRKHPVEVF